MRPITISDLLTYRKCPKAMMLRRQETAPDFETERQPLPAEAAAALRSLDRLAPDRYLFRKSVQKNHAKAAADLLIRRDDGWELLIDTNSLHLREAHVWEASFDAHVLNAAGFPVRRAVALLINPEYVRGAEIDWKALYIEQDITERMRSHETGVRSHLAQIKELLHAEALPEHELFEACLKPRECPFWEHCSAHLPKPNVFSIVGMSNRRKFQLHRNGIVHFSDCLKRAKLMKPQKMQVRFELEQKEPHVNKPAVSKFLQNIWYPVRFLDFESYQPAIPPYEGMKPFTQCAFLYSIHGLDTPDSQPEHRELFVPHGTDPRRLIAEGLCWDIPKNACVAVYSSGLEKNVVRTLAQMYPDLRPHLMQIAANMRDLLGPFRDRIYYDRRMEGSCSLKHVLPAVAPSLSYSSLSGVQNGEEAMHVYEQMGSLRPKQREKAAKTLQEYCAMDTLAMVKILKTLERAINENPSA